MENKFRTQFERLVVQVPKSDLPSKTMQEFKNDCDINYILQKINAGADITPSSVSRFGLAPRKPQFGDFTQFSDFADIQSRLLQAQANFDALPSDIRARFGYNPAALIAFIEDPANADECVRLGLATPAKSEGNVIQPVAGSQAVNNDTNALNIDASARAQQ